MSFTDSIQADLNAVAGIIRAETGCGYAAGDTAAVEVLRWVHERIAEQQEIASVSSAERTERS